MAHTVTWISLLSSLILVVVHSLSNHVPHAIEAHCKNRSQRTFLTCRGWVCRSHHLEGGCHSDDGDSHLCDCGAGHQSPQCLALDELNGSCALRGKRVQSTPNPMLGGRPASSTLFLRLCAVLPLVPVPRCGACFRQPSMATDIVRSEFPATTPPKPKRASKL